MTAKQKGKPGVFVRLDPEVLDRLQEMAGESAHGRAGGVALLVRRIIHEYLGVALPTQYGDKNRD